MSGFTRRLGAGAFGLAFAALAARAGELDLSAEALPEPSQRCVRWLASASAERPDAVRALLVPKAGTGADPTAYGDAQTGRVDCEGTPEPGLPIGASREVSGRLAVDVPSALDAGCWEIELVRGCAQRRIPLHALRAELEADRYLAWLDTGPVRARRRAENAARDGGLRVLEAVPLMALGGTLVRLATGEEPVDREAMREAALQLEVQPEYRQRESLFVGARAAEAESWAAQALDAQRLQEGVLGKGVRVALIGTAPGGEATAADFTGFEPATGFGGQVLAGVLAGLAPRAELRAFAACRDEPGLTSARCWSSALVRALDAALAAKVRIALLTWTGPEDRQVGRALERAARAGMLLLAPVGDRGDERTPAFPATHPDVIGVTAIDRDRAAFRSAPSGEGVDLAAPGVDLALVIPGSAEPRLVSGSALAAAHAAGVAALLLELAPRTKAAELRDRLSASARDLGEPGRDPVYGDGMLDACAAARALAGEGGEDPCPEPQ